jgi:hypothetical protein
MTIEEKFKEIKKQIGLFLIDNGFKKIKSHYRREFKDSRCLLLLIKPRGYSDDVVICWQLVGGVFFNALDPIFRSGSLPDDRNTASVDIRFNTTTARDVSFWEITNETVVAEHVNAFRVTNRALFEKLENTADVRIHANSRIKYYLENTRDTAANGLLEATALAKMSGRIEDYESLLKIIEERDMNMSYMNQKLAVIKENNAVI